MTTLKEMFKTIFSNHAYDRMVRSVTPLCDYFNINQFFHARIQIEGEQTYYSGVGIYPEWQEYLAEHTHLLATWPVLSKFNNPSSKIVFEGDTDDLEYKHTLEIAWKKFKVNPTLCLQKEIPKGMDIYGFGVKSRNPKAKEQLINEVSLLKKFITNFHQENMKLIALAYEHQVEISSLIKHHKIPSNPFPISPKKKLFLQQLGLEAFFSLTAREIDVVRFIASGFPANYIAQQLSLSSRTVEHHLETIKSKLCCNTKVELIKQAQEVMLIMNLTPIF